MMYKTVILWLVTSVILSIPGIAAVVLPHVRDTYLDHLIERSRDLKLSASHEWSILMHYRSALSGIESEVDDPSFFLSPSGKTDSRAELEATLTAFFRPIEPGLADSQAQCRFIARYRWLNSRLDFDPNLLAPVYCRKYSDWITALNPASVTLVFPNYFIEAPASMFGHTLLRINAKQEQNLPLLGTAVNYAAVVDADTGLLSYAFNGVFGGFKGVFTEQPYYLAVRDYNDIELRDIWEYDLNLTQSEVNRMADHLWELKQVYFDYYFFKENCSYHILSLLEAARPSLDLRSHFHLYTLPADTVKLIAEQIGLVRSRTYRPSRWSRIQFRVAGLNAEERDLLRSLMNSNGQPPTGWNRLPTTRQAVLLDIMIDLRALQDTPDAADEKDRLLTWRSRLPVGTETAELRDNRSYPDKGHGAGAFTFKLGQYLDQSDNFLEISFKPALHDLLDRDVGYIPFSEIDIFNVSLRYWEMSRKIEMEDLTILKIVSLHRRSIVNSGFSWLLDISANHARELGCVDCRTFNITPAGGYGFGLADGVVYVMAELKLKTGEVLPEGKHLAAGLLAGYNGSVSDTLKVHLGIDVSTPALSPEAADHREFVRLSFSPNAGHSLRFGWQGQNSYREITLGYRCYF